jgi:hypothetical protein
MLEFLHILMKRFDLSQMSGREWDGWGLTIKIHDGDDLLVFTPPGVTPTG